MIQLKTEEQRTEMIARMTYLLSGLRAFQREHEEMFPWQHKSTELITWEIRCDEFLKDIGATEFIPLKQLISDLSNKQA